MTNKQLYNLVFENYIQAKRELIKEGYRKESFKNVDFNEVFNKTKSVMQEEKIKSLKRENEMLKKRLQKEGLFGSMAGTGSSEVGGAGSEEVGTGMNRIGAFFKHKGSIAALTAQELDKDFDKMMKAYNTPKKGLIDAFKYKMTVNLEKGMSKDEAKREALADMGYTLAESKKRRRY
jgi:hypothetical protein